MNAEKKHVYQLIEIHYRQYRKILVNSARNMVGDWAEDAVQETYTRALQYWNSYDFNLPFDAWMTTLFKNATLNMYSINKGWQQLDDAKTAENSFARNKPLSNPFTSQHLKEVLKRINQEPKDNAYIYRLALIQQFTFPEIAQIVNGKVNAIEQMVSRFRAKLVKEMT